jgi:transcriptional regulator with XRE-family HTH domain
MFTRSEIMVNPKPKEKPTINLKVLREKQGWTKAQAAENLGFSRPHYSDVENGKKGISVKMMHAIMNVFKVKYEDFYKNDNPR